MFPSRARSLPLKLLFEFELNPPPWMKNMTGNRDEVVALDGAKTLRYRQSSAMVNRELGLVVQSVGDPGRQMGLN